MCCLQVGVGEKPEVLKRIVIRGTCPIRGVYFFFTGQTLNRSFEPCSFFFFAGCAFFAVCTWVHTAVLLDLPVVPGYLSSVHGVTIGGTK